MFANGSGDRGSIPGRVMVVFYCLFSLQKRKNRRFFCLYFHLTGHFIYWVECLPMARETGVQSQVESCQRLKKWYLIPPCLTLSNIRYGSKVKWSNPENGVTPSSTPRCSSYWKGSLRVANFILLISNYVLVQWDGLKWNMMIYCLHYHNIWFLVFVLDRLLATLIFPHSEIYST